MVQTKMATSTEAVGNVAVEVPPEMEAELVNSPHPDGENNIPSEESVEEPIQEPQHEEPEPELSSREERRAAKLIPKLKEESQARQRLEQENSALKEMLKGYTPGFEEQTTHQPAFTPPWAQNNQPIIQPNENGELNPDDLQRAVVQTADQIVNVKLTQFRSEQTRFENLKEDVSYIQNKYKPSQEDEKTITELYQQASKGNPSLRLKDFAEPILKRIQAGTEQGKQEITPKILKQEAEGAVPPSGGSIKKSGNSEPETLEEMEAYLKANGLWDEA